MRKHRQSAGANQVTNEINTLKDGVGRQAPSKRMPTEAEEIINCQVTLERNIQKRPGMQALLTSGNLGWSGFTLGSPPLGNPTSSNGSYDTALVDERIGLNVDQDAKYIWFELSSDNLFLIQILLSTNTWAQAVTAQQEVIKIVKINDDSTWTLQDTIVAGGPDITESGYNYLMYGSLNYGSRIKHVNAGADILLLNSEVYAGFSSTLDPSDNLWKLHGLNGVRTSTEDIKGRKVSYYPAGNRDTESESRIYQQDSFYFRGDRIWRPTNTNTSVTPNVLASWGAVYQALDDRDTTSSGQRPVAVTPVQNVDGTWSPPDIDLDPYGDGHSGRERHGWKLLRYLGDIEVEFNTNVEDLNNYPVGAAVNSFRDLPFPPRLGELNDLNFIWWYEFPGPYSAEYLAPIETIALLYDGWNGSNRRTDGTPTNGGSAGSPLGRGGLFYCKNAFLEALPGWYRAINTTVAPYYQRIRSPYPYGRFDENRMPHKLYRNSAGEWKLETVNWDMRLAGSDSDNPGPSAFKEGRQTPIRDIAVFQNRLYFAADDTVFSSRLGEFEDFFIADPGNITDSDPIDTTLSTNSYAEVEYMIPFRDQLFIVTNASTQFILTGFDNVVSPFTVEIQPISFYTTSGVTNPVTVGNSVYFANNRRMYMYYPQNVEAGMTVEMTKHCPDYLPESPTGLYTATANDTMFVSSDEDWINRTFPHELFCYTNRYSGNQMVQNALHKWQLDVKHPLTSVQETRFSKHKLTVRSAYTKNNYLYVVYSSTASGNGMTIATPSGGIYLGRILLRDSDLQEPRLDNYFKYTQTGTPDWIYYTNVDVSGFTSLTYTDRSEFLDDIGLVLLEEGFETYTPQSITTPFTLPDSNIVVDVQGDWTSVNTLIGLGSAFSQPSGGTQLFRVELGESATQDYTIEFQSPNLAYSFGFNISGYQSSTIDVALYDDEVLVVNETVNITSLTNSFVGVVSEALFDRAIITVNHGALGFDAVGVDDIVFGYSPPAPGVTWFCVPYSSGQIDTVYLGDGWGEDAYKTLAVKIQAYVDNADVNKPSWVGVQGNYSAPLVNAADSVLTGVVGTFASLPENPVLNGLYRVIDEGAVYRWVGAWVLNNVRTWVDQSNNSQLSAVISFGRRFPMEVELSQQFIRDQNNNVIEGVLSLRQLICRHRNSAEYKVLSLSDNEVLRAFSEFKTTKKVNELLKIIQLPLDANGELVAKVLGFSETTKIKITSDSVLPVNITNMTIRGKFRRKNSSFLS